MTWKAYWRLTFVLLLMIGGWLLVVALIEGSAPLTAIKQRYDEELFFRLPVALPFWRDLFAAPLISGLVAAAIYASKKIDEADARAQARYGFALIGFCATTFLDTFVAMLASNAGLLISLSLGVFCAVALIGGIVLGIKVIRYLSQWVFEP